MTGNPQIDASTPPLGGRVLYGLLVGAGMLLVLQIADLAGFHGSFLLLLPAILIAGLRWGFRSALAASLAGLVTRAWPVVVEGAPADPLWVTSMVELLIVFTVVAFLAGRSRQSNLDAREREQLQATLRKLSHDLAGASGLDRVCSIVVDTLQERIGFESAILQRESEGSHRLIVACAGLTLTDHDYGEIERHAAGTLEKGNVLNLGSLIVYPLLSAGDLLGILVVRRHGKHMHPSSEGDGLLRSIVIAIATAMQREVLVQQTMQADLYSRHRDLYSALLSSISHDFRTPLASISGAAETLAMPRAFLSEEARQDMVSMIREEADRLNRFVANLLDMTKIESGVLELNSEKVDVSDLIGTAVMRSRRRMTDYEVEVKVPTGLPMISVDFVLIEHVLTNLLENAVKYSESGTTIRVEGDHVGDAIAIRVIDQGKGIPSKELDKVFEKFYRVQRGDKVSAGTGLGLSICHGIVAAHRGTIRAISPVSQDGKGTMIEVLLPLDLSRETIEESPMSLSDQP